MNIRMPTISGAADLFRIARRKFGGQKIIFGDPVFDRHQKRNDHYDVTVVVAVGEQRYVCKVFAKADMDGRPGTLRLTPKGRLRLNEIAPHYPLTKPRSYPVDAVDMRWVEKAFRRELKRQKGTGIKLLALHAP